MGLDEADLASVARPSTPGAGFGCICAVCPMSPSPAFPG